MCFDIKYMFCTKLRTTRAFPSSKYCVLRHFRRSHVCPAHITIDKVEATPTYIYIYVHIYNINIYTYA